MEKASERVPPNPKPLTWHQLRDLEYAGRRPDPFRTSESYDEHGKLLNPVGGEPDTLRTTEIPPQKKEMEKASERVPSFPKPPKPLTWLQMRDLEYAGRRPDPFRTSESYDEHGRLLNPIGGGTNYLQIVNRLKFAFYEPPPMPPPPITPTPHTFETEYGLQKLASEKCLYCTKLGHGTAYCSYMYRVPKNAPVGPGCDLVCRLCGSPFSGTCCGLDEGRAILKECLTCASYGDHWPRQCPRNKGLFDLDLPRGVFCLDISRSGSASAGNVEQKEPAEPSSVKSNAVKDDDSEDDHDSDDEDEETPTPSKTGSKKRARASTSAKTPVSAGKAKIDTDGDKGAYRETPHTTEKGMSPELVKWMESFKILYRTPGGFTVSQRQE